MPWAGGREPLPPGFRIQAEAQTLLKKAASRKKRAQPVGGQPKRHPCTRKDDEIHRAGYHIEYACVSTLDQNLAPQGRRTRNDFQAARTLLANPDITVAEVTERLGVSPATLYRYLPAARTANNISK
nr:helix-turn-helix domain-containing protein [Methylosinus sporium]